MSHIEVKLAFDHEACFDCPEVGVCPAGRLLTKLTTDLTEIVDDILDAHKSPARMATAEEDTDGEAPLQDVADRIGNDLIANKRTYDQMLQGADVFFKKIIVAQNRFPNKYLDVDDRGAQLIEAAEEFAEVYPPVEELVLINGKPRRPGEPDTSEEDTQAGEPEGHERPILTIVSSATETADEVEPAPAESEPLNVLSVDALQACAEEIIRFHRLNICQAVQLDFLDEEAPDDAELDQVVQDLDDAETEYAVLRDDPDIDDLDED